MSQEFIAFELFNDANRIKILDNISYFKDRLLPYNNHHYIKSFHIMNKYIIDYSYLYQIIENYIGNYDTLSDNDKQRISNIIHSSRILYT